MTFSSIDKLAALPSAVSPLDRDPAQLSSGADVAIRIPPLDGRDDQSLFSGASPADHELNVAVEPLDPHSVLALDAWPATGPRVFDSLSTTADPIAHTAARENLDDAAAHIIAFLT